MSETQQVREARRAVVESLVARLTAENTQELTLLREELRERCQEYNALIGAGRTNQITRGSNECQTRS